MARFRMKPPGSLGYLEKVAVKIAGITGDEFYKINRALHIVASADNGIVEEGVSSCPVEYTRVVSEAMLNEIAAIGVICKNVGVDLKLIDIGIVEYCKYVSSDLAICNLFGYTIPLHAPNRYPERCDKCKQAEVKEQ